MRVPFIDLGRATRDLLVGVEDDWRDVLQRCEFVGGPRVQELERVLARQLGVAQVVSCANGTDALAIGLQALGVRPGDVVALPNLTFWATYEAVVQIGARPLLVDIDADDLQLDLDGFRHAHDAHRFRAAIFVHLFGWTSARLGELRRLCDEREILLLEDGAQCYGVTVEGVPVLSGARMGTISFYPAKVIGGAMDGGAITCSTAEQADLVRSLCNHGRAAHYSYAHVGWNSRMGGLQAAYLLRVCAATERILADRRASLSHYEALLDGAPGVRVHRAPRGVVGNGYLLVAEALTRDGASVVKDLEAAGIGAARTYPETLSEQRPAAGALATSELSVSRAFCRRVVNLPLFYGITAAERSAAAAALRAATTSAPR